MSDSSNLRGLAAVRGLRANRLSRAICTLMSSRTHWQGTSTQLLEELRRLYPNDRRLAVQTPNGLGQRLSKLRPIFAEAGLIEIVTERVGHERTRMIFLTSLDQSACENAAADFADNADNVRAKSEDAERAFKLAVASLAARGGK